MTLKFQILIVVQSAIIVSMSAYIYTNNNAPSTNIIPAQASAAPVYRPAEPVIATSASVATTELANATVLDKPAQINEVVFNEVVFEESPLVESIAQSEDLISQMEGLDSVTMVEYLRHHENELFDIANEHPELIPELLEKFSLLQDIDFEQEQMLTQVIATSGAEYLEEHAINQLQQSSELEKRKWIHLLSFVGAKTRNSRSMLLDGLAHTDDHYQIQLSVDSLAPYDTDSNERAKIVSALSQFTTHENPGVRASTVRSLGFWSKDPAYILNGLNDSNITVRQAALESAMHSNAQSDEIQHRLYAIMSDDTQRIEQRIQAANGLQAYDLPDYMFGEVSSFFSQLKL